MSLLLTFLLLLFTKFYGYTEAARPFDVQWLAVNCSIMDNYYISYFDCPLIELPKKRGNYINSDLIAKVDIEKFNFDFRISIPRMGTESGDFELLRFKTNGCNIFRYRAKNTVLNAIIQELLQSSNYPKYCPFKANTTYKVEHYSLNPDHFPFYTPDMNFTTRLFAISQRKTVIVAVTLNAMLMRRN